MKKIVTISIMVSLLAASGVILHLPMYYRAIIEKPSVIGIKLSVRLEI